jgi:hypothetical protein
VGGAGPAVNAYFHYFPFLPDDAPPPTSSSSSPASRPASLHRRAPLRPEATEVRTPFLPSCGRHGLRAEAERLPLRAAAGDAGHRARLGRIFLQVPPPSSTRARRSPSQPPLAVGNRPVLVAAAPCRRVRVACTFARASMRAATPSHRRAPQHACAVTLEARPGLWSVFAPAPPLVAVPRRAAPQWPRRDHVGHAHGRQREGTPRRHPVLAPSEPSNPRKSK